MLRQWLLFILLTHKQKVEIRSANLLVNEYFKLFFNTNSGNSSTCQRHIQQEQCNNSTSHLLVRTCLWRHGGYSMYQNSGQQTCLSLCIPYSSPPQNFLHPTLLSVRTSSLKNLKPPFYLHTQISTLTFTLGVQVLHPPKIPLKCLLLLILFHYQRKLCASRRTSSLWERFSFPALGRMLIWTHGKCIQVPISPSWQKTGHMLDQIIQDWSVCRENTLL